IGTTAHLPDTVVHAALGLWCAALAAVTLAHLPVWHDSIALTSHALRYNPDCFVCHANYGAALVDRGDVEEGAPHLERAIALEPEARVLVQLGNVRLAQGRTEEAIAHYERALRLEPDDKLAHYNLGVALRDAGRAAEAVPHYRAALRVDPQWPDAHNNLGVAYRELGKDEAAAAEFDAVLRVLPDDVPANLNRAAVAAAKEDWTTAIPYYERALRADPAS